MKNSIAFISVILAMGVACAVVAHKNLTQQAEITSLKSDVAKQSQTIVELQTEQQRGEKVRKEQIHLSQTLSAQLAKQSAETSKVSPAPASTEKTEEKPGAGFGKMMSQMMKDPAMKKMISDQQRLMANQLYSPLIKQLGLSSEEGEKLKNLIADNMTQSSEKSTALLDSSATNRSEMLASVAEDQKSSEEQIKALLGEPAFTQYKDYQLTVGERMQLAAFKQQSAGTDHPLSDQQTEQLLALMKEEKQNAPAELPQTGPGSNGANMEAMLSEEKSQQMLEAQEAVNQRVYDRASAVLSPEQLEAFGKYQTNQTQMMKLGFTMARKFMAPDKAGKGQ